MYCVEIEEYIKRFGNNYEIFINESDYFNAVAMIILQISEIDEEMLCDTANTDIPIMHEFCKNIYLYIDLFLAHALIAYLEIESDTKKILDC